MKPTFVGDVSGTLFQFSGWQKTIGKNRLAKDGWQKTVGNRRLAGTCGLLRSLGQITGANCAKKCVDHARNFLGGLCDPCRFF
jgi:hypothetical protein